MTVQNKPLTLKLEAILWAAITIAAVMLRLPALGGPPLNDAEALSAFTSLSQDMPRLDEVASPLITVLNTGVFAVTGGTDASARFLPALFGIILCSTPLLLKKRLGTFSALLASLWLALSPTPTAASRAVTGQTGALLAAVVLLSLCLVGFNEKRTARAILCGAVGAAGLLADEGFGLILLAFGGGLLFARLTDDEGTFGPMGIRAKLRGTPWVTIILAFAGTAFLLATGFFLFPTGLSALGGQIASLVSGFWRDDPTALAPIISLFTYEFFLLGIGGFALWRFALSPDPFQRFLSGWSLTALLIALFYQGAGPLDGLYLVLPLILLASQLVTRLLNQLGDFRIAGPAFAIAVIALLAMIANNLNIFQGGQRAAVFGSAAFLGDAPLDLILAGLWALLLIVITATVWLNRGRLTAGRGFAIAWATCGLLFGLGDSVQLAFTAPGNPYALLRPASAQPTLPLMIDEIKGVSALMNGGIKDAQIIVEGSDHGALAWALRDFTYVTYVDIVSSTTASDMIITPLSHANLLTAADYVGQDFTVTASWAPGGMTFGGVIGWLFTDRAVTPPVKDGVILWVRDDIYLLQQNIIR